MNLKDFLTNRDKPPELYWSLVLEEGYIQAGVWYIGEEAAEVVNTSPPTPWEVPDELVGAADAALSTVIQKLPEEYPEPTKTVFGVPSAWVKNGEINEERLLLIKKVCTDLSLNPVGFVVLPEAIAHLYKSEEGVPVNAIILGLGHSTLEIAIFKLGNLAGTAQVARSVSLTEDVTEGLSRFEGATPLPSRFIIFDGKGGELEEAKETLLKHTWEETPKIKFLHTPKVEILTSDRKVLATSLAGANEIGNVSKVLTQEDKMEVSGVLPGEEVQNVAPPSPEVSPEDLGFVVGEDVSEKPRTVPVVPAQTAKVESYIQRTKNSFYAFSKKIFSPPKITGTGTKKPLATLSVFLTILLIAAGLGWWLYPTASILIYVTPKSFQEEIPVTFNIGGQFDAASGTIPAQTITTQVSGDKTKATSGSKLIGDKAKGNIQIQNGTAFPINLTAGTVLISSGNLKFGLDNAASVSAAFSPSSPGTANISVTADTIGAEYNLAKSEIFRVGNYPKAEVDATSLADFGGGSSRQISAVSKDDVISLGTELKNELLGKAKDDLVGKVNSDQIFVTDLVSSDISSENFSHKVGDEASDLKLSVTLTAVAVAADRAKLLEYARGVLKDKIPGGFVLRDSQITFNFSFTGQKDGNISYKITIGANFLPQTNTDEIVSHIVGRTPKVVEDYLAQIPGYIRASVSLKPRLPGFLGTLPRVKKNIVIEIVAEK